jgi:Na+-transporting methylmalonyl-CoA/oxaloacetate decarboxylase gamma subunit
VNSDHHQEIFMNFCPSCGLESTPGLNYCKRCGGTLAIQALQPHAQIVSVGKPALAVSLTLVFTNMTGLIGYFVFLSDVLRSGNPVSSEMLTFLGIMVFSLLLVVDVMLIRLLSRLIDHSLETAKPAAPIKPTVKAVEEAYTPLLTAQPLSSVVDSTTQLIDRPVKEPARQRVTNSHELG